MELIVKHFSELSAEELFEIYKLRISVFVVEQNCPYQEADDADRAAYHAVSYTHLTLPTNSLV